MATKKKVEKYRLPARQVAGMAEVGYTGLNQSAGTLREEFHPELTGRGALRIYKEMWYNDAIVNAIMFAVTMLIRSAKWRARPWAPPAEIAANNEPPEPTPKAKKDAWFLTSCMDDMSHTWEDFVAEVLSMLIFGYSPHEIVYKKRQGLQKDEGDSSKFDDGLIGWRKLPIRSQDSVQKWEFDDRGGWRGLWQMTSVGQKAFIPITKLLLFRTSTYKNNPEGRSMLRGCYRSWYFKKRLEEVEGIGAERDMSGLPVLTAAEGINLWDDTDPEAEIVRKTAERIVTNIRRDEQEGLLLPFGWTFTLASTQGRSRVDTDAIISRYETRMAMTMLADFIILGHNNRYGSFALGSSKTNMFELAITGWLDVIKSVMNKYAVPRLFAVNGLPFDQLPTLEYEPISVPDLEVLGAFIGRLYASGMKLFPNKVLEAHLLRTGAMPTEGVELGQEREDLKPKPIPDPMNPGADGRGGRIPARVGPEKRPTRPAKAVEDDDAGDDA